MPPTILTKPRTLREVRANEVDQGAVAMANLESNGVLADVQLSGYEDEHTKRIKAADHLLRKTGMVSLRPVLPLLLNLKGKPYTLKNHFPFEPFFRTRMAKSTLLKTGRQVSKSTSLASQGVVFSNCIPYFSTIYVTPLYEMIRRFSTSYVGDFLQNSPVAKLFLDSRTMNSVLQRKFKNNSQMFFSFAFLSADRTRGIPADKMVVDEVQDMNSEFLPIIAETMSGSPWGISQFAGTPKSLDNTIQKLWGDSSQAEWVMKCQHAGCGHWNVPALSHDLLKMIGPVRLDISEEYPGVVCAKCQKPLNPRLGRWVHAVPDQRWNFAGYHVPQCIMPMHYANIEKWAVLYGKSQGRYNTPENVFLNEACGESCDTGARLVTETDIVNACCLPWENALEAAVAASADRGYVHRILAVDWGGGAVTKISGKGKAEGGFKTMPSYTTLAAMGMLADGTIEVFWGLRSNRPEHVYEAKLCLGAIKALRLSHLAHDYTGAGSLRETIINQVGYPFENLIPIQLGRTGVGNIITPHEATEQHPRDFYVVDKPRSLLLTTQMLKSGRLKFFKYDYKGSEDKGLMRDFLALIEEKSSSRLGADVFTVHKDPNLTDDFAQAVNIGCVTLWQMSGRWPDVAAAARMEMDPSLLEIASPAGPVTWNDSWDLF